MKSQTDQTNRTQAQQDARLGLDKLRREIRCASGLTTPSGYPASAITITLGSYCPTAGGAATTVTWCTKDKNGATPPVAGAALHALAVHGLGLLAAPGRNGRRISWTRSTHRASPPARSSTRPPLPAATLTPATTGGTLAAGTYSYDVTAVLAGGVEVPGTVASVTIASGLTNKITVSWSAYPGATSYNVYGRDGSGLRLLKNVTAARRTSTPGRPRSPTNPLTLPSATIDVADTSSFNSGANTIAFGASGVVTCTGHDVDQLHRLQRRPGGPVPAEHAGLQRVERAPAARDAVGVARGRQDTGEHEPALRADRQHRPPEQPAPSEMGMALAAIALLPGLAFGSFLNVVAARIPLRRSLVSPGSACMACGTPLAWYDNIPLLSFALLRGRCRHCQAAIPWRYPLVEATTAFLVAACVLRFGLTWDAAVAAFFCAALVAISATDAERHIIPNRIVLPAAAVVLAANTMLHPSVEWAAAGLGAALFLFVAALAYPAGMGMGDVKLALLLGVALGRTVPVAMMVGMVSALVPSIVLFARHGSAARKMKIPFGPFLAFGGVVALFAGQALLDAYLRLL